MSAHIFKTALPYVKESVGADGVKQLRFHRGSHTVSLPPCQDQPGFFRLYRDAMLRAGVTSRQVMSILQRTPGTLSHAVQQWKTAMRQNGSLIGSVAISAKAGDEICRVAGWMHADGLTSTHVDFICTTDCKNKFARLARLAALRLVLRHAGSTQRIAPSQPPTRRTTKPASRPCVFWTTGDLNAFQRMFPVGTVEHTAATLMALLQPSPARLVHLDAAELDTLCPPLSRFGADVHAVFADLPSGLYGAVEDMRQMNGARLAARLRAATARAGVPHLTLRSVGKLNADLIGGMIAGYMLSCRNRELIDGLL